VLEVVLINKDPLPPFFFEKKGVVLVFFHVCVIRKKGYGVSFVGKHVSVTSSTGIAATHYGDLVHNSLQVQDRL
jgi:hypothetical protein